MVVGVFGDDYDILVESVGDGRLFFAGEVITRRYFVIMYGAFFSGFREVVNMVYYFSVRVLKLKIERSVSKNLYICVLYFVDFFREFDLEFGSFFVIFEKDNGDFKLVVIFRVIFIEFRKKSYNNGLKVDM